MKTLIAALLFVPNAALSAERDYQLPWCASQGGKTEVVLPDRTRVDCLTETHAIEVDFAPKWAEALGQALHYSLMTGKRAGILLIVGPTEQGHLERLRAIIASLCLRVDVWTVPR